MAEKNELIICIVNNGWAEQVMDAAREAGAGGGTILSGRGTADKKAEAFYNISIQPEKDAVMLIVPSEITDRVLHALYRKVGLETPGQGIAFSLPVNRAVGLRTRTDEKNGEKSDGAGEKTES